MKFIHVYRIAKFIKNGDGESLKEYAKSLSPEDVASLRIEGVMPFKIASLAARWYLRNKVTDKGEQIPKAHGKYYRDISKDTMVEFDRDLLINQKAWNVLKLIDEVDVGMFLAVEKEGGRFDGFEDTLQWNTYYCSALLKVLPYLTDSKDIELYTGAINDLLIGINKCVRKDSIVRHPLKTIRYDMEPISQDMLSGLIQLLLVNERKFKKFPMLRMIKCKVAKLFIKTNYCLMYPDGTVTSYDFKPNYIYNHAKSFVYTGLRMITGEYNSRDREIVQQMMRIMPYSSERPEERSMYGKIVACNTLEAIALTDRKLLLDAIDWVQYTSDTSYELNPEIDSILCSLYRQQGYKTRMEKYASRTVRGLSSMLDIGVEKPGNMVRDSIEGNHPRPAILRHNDDWFWQRRAYYTGVTANKANMIEFSGAFARVLPVVYYPGEE